MRTSKLVSERPRAVKTPKRNDHRVILHFDYDCFYASVFENENPGLKSLPLGIKQKSILATCNYVARARGVKKLMLISEAQKICPDLVLMNGEDLTRFRTASKKLLAVLRAHSWNNRVERLGLDEVFLDVTDVIAYNHELINVHSLKESFFQLDRVNPEKGFSFDGTRFYGRVYPPDGDSNHASRVDAEDPLSVRLMIASHLAGYLRHKLDTDFGYTSSVGISTNKTLAKLSGSVNKPDAQTTLLNFQGACVQDFMDSHALRKVPGIGSRIAQSIQDHVLSTFTPYAPHDFEEGTKVTVKEVRTHPDMSSDILEQILDRPGSERGSGEKIWNLLHGVDDSEVKELSDVPTQLSIEDTYMARPLNTPAEVNRGFTSLATSLVKRMRVELLDIDPYADNSTNNNNNNNNKNGDIPGSRWLAYPKTLRLSTRTRSKPTCSTTSNPDFTRHSRSLPIPSYIFTLNSPPELLADRLVSEALLPLFRRLHAERAGWNLALINICVTNMVLVARDGDDDNGNGVGGGTKGPGGRDIGRMFRTQEDKLREFTVYDTTPLPKPEPEPEPAQALKSTNRMREERGAPVHISHTDEEKERTGRRDQTNWVEAADNEDLDMDSWIEECDDDKSQRCPLCGQPIPDFAAEAHRRFHAMGD
ncbi:DNA/RNA polymerase [Xylariaceae sp. FL0016]|nr:DNA/RNA polymerase [Xylariaceae sp. FL0016]